MNSLPEFQHSVLWETFEVRALVTCFAAHGVKENIKGHEKIMTS